MTNTMNRSLASRMSRSALGRGLWLLLVITAAAGTAPAQTARPGSATSSGSDKRQHGATIRSNDSSEGSRVSITADISLNDYEAYRRGDRFYVKLPAIDLPRAQTLKGRGFEDVKVQRSADSTVLSFRLDPGASARVEQHANRLEVVVVAAGASLPSARTNPTPSVAKPRATEADSSRRSTTTKQANAREANSSRTRSGELPRIDDNQKGRRGATRESATRESATREGATREGATRAAAASAGTNSRSKATTSPSPKDSSSTVANSGSKTPASPSTKDSGKASNAEGAGSSASATPPPFDKNQSATGTESQSATTSSTPAMNGSQVGSQTNSPADSSPANQSTPRPTAPTGDVWASRIEDLKERARYLMLLGRLNPIPLAMGLGILLLLIALFIFQRRRARATRRVRQRTRVTNAGPTVKADANGADTVTKSTETAAASEAHPEPIKSGISEAELVTAGAATGAAAATMVGSNRGPIAEVEPNPTGATVASSLPARHARVADEVKHVLAGDGYDESVIGAHDSATRKMVAAELLASLASRNPQRRDRAREVFMKHGYFDDATRDLRLAESPADRASAARRLSFVRDRDAAPHLIAALEDSAPEVRRAAVEALVDSPDPVAIAPLNNLLKTETNRKVPQALIRHAIDACATCKVEQQPAVSAVGAGSSAAPSSELRPPLAEQEREVLEI